MPGTTASGYPYPLGTEPVAQGDDAIHALADKIEANLRATAAGVVTITTVANTYTTVAVTFPVGRFTVAPTVVVSWTTNAHNTTMLGCAATSITAAGCNVGALRTSASPTQVAWIATT